MLASKGALNQRILQFPRETTMTRGELQLTTPIYQGKGGFMAHLSGLPHISSVSAAVRWNRSSSLP